MISVSAIYLPKTRLHVLRRLQPGFGICVFKKVLFRADTHSDVFDIRKLLFDGGMNGFGNTVALA